MKSLFELYWDNVFALGLATVAIGQILSLLWRRPNSPRGPSRLVVGGSFMILTLALAHMAFYALLPTFADYGEPVIPILAANLLNGTGVYMPVDNEAQIIGSNYGPLIFLIQSVSLSVSQNVFASKIPGILAGAATLLVIYAYASGVLRSARSGVWAVALGVVLLAFHLHYWFWNRPDSVLILLVALGCLAHLELRPGRALLVIAALAGAAINLKLFAPIYVVPLALAMLVAMPAREVLKRITVGLVIFLTLAIAPFFHPAISASAYFENILMMKNQGLDVPGMRASAFYAALVFLPVTTLFFRAPRRSRPWTIYLTTLVCTATIVLLSAKPGGGSIYIMPFVPLVVYLIVHLSALPFVGARPVLGAPAITFFVTVAVFSAPLWAYSWYQMAKQLKPDAALVEKSAELRALFQTYPRAEMGHSMESDAALDEFLRVEKPFLKQASNFDYVNYADQRKAGLDSARIEAFLEVCRVPEWIFATAVTPFSGTEYGMEVFEPSTRALFFERYEKVQSLTYFEVWSCRADASTAPQRG